MRKRLAWAFKKAQEVNQREKKRNKRNYDREARCSKLEKGDQVLVRQKAFKGKYKIQDYWEEDIYVVIAQPIENFPIFMVQSDRSKKSKALHRICYFHWAKGCSVKTLVKKLRFLIQQVTMKTKERILKK